MKIEVSDEVGWQLQRLADERNLYVAELISAMLEQYDGRHKAPTLADFARIAVESPMASDAPVDTSERSREMPSASIEETPGEDECEYPPGSLGRFAQQALKRGLASKDPVDTSIRSREILNADLADHVDRRIRT